MTTSTLPKEKEGMISLTRAASELGCARKTMDYYVRVLELQTFKMPLDLNMYLTPEDFSCIRELREAAAKRRAKSAQ